MDVEEKIKEAKEFLEANGYKVYKDYSCRIGKWVAFRQEGMKPVLHGRVVWINIFEHYKVRCKNGEIRFPKSYDIIGVYDNKSECYAVK